MAGQRDELLTVAQVLALLGDVSPRTFYRWRETGKAPKAVRLPNGELRIVATRDQLVAQGLAVRAPCFYRGACPALLRETL